MGCLFSIAEDAETYQRVRINESDAFFIAKIRKQLYGRIRSVNFKK